MLRISWHAVNPQWRTRISRGGIRVIYYWITAEDQIWLLTLYAKTEMETYPLKQITQALTMTKRVVGKP